MIFNTIYGGGVGCKPFTYARYEIANAVANTQYDISDDAAVEDHVICVRVNGENYYVYRTEYGSAINYEGASYMPFELVQYDGNDNKLYITFKSNGDYYGQITRVCPDSEPLVVTLTGELNPSVGNTMDTTFMDILVAYLMGRPIIFRANGATNYYSMYRIYQDSYNYKIDFIVYDGAQYYPMSFTTMDREDYPSYNTIE